MKFQRIAFIFSAHRLSEPNCLNLKSGIIIKTKVHSTEDYMKSPNRWYLAFNLNLQVESVERSKHEGTDNVTDEKFFLILKSKPIQLGQIKFQVYFCALWNLQKLICPSIKLVLYSFDLDVCVILTNDCNCAQ